MRIRCGGAGVKPAKAVPKGLIVVSDTSTADLLLLCWVDGSGDIESHSLLSSAVHVRCGGLGKSWSHSGVDNVYEKGTVSRIGSNQILVVQFTVISCGDCWCRWEAGCEETWSRKVAAAGIVIGDVGVEGAGGIDDAGGAVAVAAVGGGVSIDVAVVESVGAYAVGGVGVEVRIVVVWQWGWGQL